MTMAREVVWISAAPYGLGCQGRRTSSSNIRSQTFTLLLIEPLTGWDEHFSVSSKEPIADVVTSRTKINMTHEGN